MKKNTFKILKILEGQFELNGEKNLSTILIESDKIDKDWIEKQNSAEEHYLTDIEVGVNEKIEYIQKQFQNYLNIHLNGNVIDIGCGISKERPNYVKKVKNFVYHGLDPFQLNLEREYPFICATLEDAADVFVNPLYDGAIFSTSLDHFASMKECSDSIKKVCKTGSIVCFWNGVHDPQLIGSLKGIEIFEKVFSPISFILSVSKLIGYSLLYFPREVWRIKKRQNNLIKNIPLDIFHFHYFTKESGRNTLQKYFGEIIDETHVLGTNSIFYAVKI